MMFLKIVVSGLLVTYVLSEGVITNSEQEMDTVIEMLMNNEVLEYMDSEEKAMEEENKAEEPVFENGIWKCGKCDNLDESKLIYMETYDVEANYEEDYMNLQVGLSLHKVSCVTVMSRAGEIGALSRVSGDCNGYRVTLRVSGTAQYDVRAYE